MTNTEFMTLREQYINGEIAPTGFVHNLQRDLEEHNLTDVSDAISSIMFLYGDSEEHSYGIDEKSVEEFANILSNMLYAEETWEDFTKQLDDFYSNEIDRLF